MKLTIFTPIDTFYEGEVSGLNIETRLGQRTILENHVDFLGFIEYSKIVILESEGGKEAYLDAGFVHVYHNEIKIFCEMASVTPMKEGVSSGVIRMD
ncbi:F0F1 ATP synthase subunit epsilon [Enterococcus faecalis]|nr:F0F1 ATP synthase subunit epsilon [Enterococcus faecalis]